MTTSVFTEAEIEARVTILKAELLETDTAISKCLEAQQYTIDTGQTRHSHMRAQLSQLRAHRRELMAELQELQDLISGSASYVARPGYG